MRRNIIIAGLATITLVLSLVFSSAYVGADPVHTTKKVRCDKTCRRSNDFYIPASDYRDYFVCDSDGCKDMVWSDFDYDPFEGVHCKVIKNDSSNNYIIAAILCQQKDGSLVMTGVPGPKGPQGE
jgi:hypothetical protein